MWYWLFRIIFKAIFKFCFSLKVEGLENLPESNFIIVSNHTSYLDALLFVAAIPRKIHCLSSYYLFKIIWLKYFLRLIEALPTGGSAESAVHFLENNKNIGLFPEGGISQDGKLKEFRNGAALLAFRTGRPIVPSAVIGAFAAYPITAKFPRFLPIIVKIGKPIYLLKEFDEIIDDLKLQEGLARVREAIKEMLNER
ncbi:MAG: 1-acyl-sn-glycerol-3-phosphate acyltransferase [Elusimicrobia bacterium]|nr:1-acyl-sn-glycerol-3-phosphate acyltransferase [Elusimicrobiota bacterium]